jgi:hypothetical protein
MAFTAGMHQPVTNTDVDFDAVFGKMAGVKPRNAVPSMGYGRKCFIEAVVRKKKTGYRIAIEVFVEVTFGKTPSDRSIGYTKDEASITRGVSIITFVPEPDAEGRYESEGEVMDYEDFVKRYLYNENTRVVLERIMTTMEASMAISDKMLDHVNSAWCNRDIGEKELFSIQYQ